MSNKKCLESSLFGVTIMMLLIAFVLHIPVYKIFVNFFTLVEPFTIFLAIFMVEVVIAVAVKLKPAMQKVKY